MYRIAFTVDKHFDAPWSKGGPFTSWNCRVPLPGQQTLALTRAHAEAVSLELASGRLYALSTGDSDRYPKDEPGARRMWDLRLKAVWVYLDERVVDCGVISQTGRIQWATPLTHPLDRRAAMREITRLRSQASMENRSGSIDTAQQLWDHAIRELILQLGGTFREVATQSGWVEVGDTLWVRYDRETRSFRCEGRAEQLACGSVAELDAKLKRHWRLELPSDLMVQLLREKDARDHLGEAVEKGGGMSGR